MEMTCWEKRWNLKLWNFGGWRIELSPLPPPHQEILIFSKGKKPFLLHYVSILPLYFHSVIIAFLIWLKSYRTEPLFFVSERWQFYWFFAKSNRVLDTKLWYFSAKSIGARRNNIKEESLILRNIHAPLYRSLIPLIPPLFRKKFMQLYKNYPHS
jgi:hypothetical protein